MVAKFFDSISDEQAGFIARQKMFFVATAPVEGRINISPKGLDGSFVVLTPTRVAFANLTGSGNETAAHLRQNGRITVMFCAFEDKPLILRLYGRGRAVHPRDSEWDGLLGRFENQAAARQIVVVDVVSVNASCGFGVPMMEFVAQRDMLPGWAEKKGPEGLARYRADNNRVSFDGLPTGLDEA